MNKFGILVLHGPNLNLLGIREPEVYGKHTLQNINDTIREFCKKQGVEVEIYQSNSEGALIDKIHQQRNQVQGMVINPGAYTHYSYAIRDAIAAVGFPTVEVHLSDIKNREDFRKKSVIAPVCIEQISGLGVNSYIIGIKKLLAYLKNRGE
jgi:3-dehydroquinate dehydratase-2